MRGQKAVVSGKECRVSRFKDIKIARVSDEFWLVINQKNATAFRVNNAAHSVLLALQKGEDVSEAYKKSSIKSEVSEKEFVAAAHAITVRYFQSGVEKFSQMSWGFWIAGPKVMSAIANCFKGLLNPWVVGANLIFAPGIILGLQTSLIDPGPIKFGAGLPVLLLIISSVLFHEIGHCAALLRNGRTVGRLGAGVTMVFPAFFTNILEHEVMSRREKLEVDAAGVYFQLVFANALLLLCALSGNNVLSGAAAAVLILAAIQMLPIGTLDGHWLLQDLMGGRFPALRRLLVVASYLIVLVLVVRLAIVLVVPFWQKILDGSIVEAWASIESGQKILTGSIGTVVCALWVAAGWRFLKRIIFHPLKNGRVRLPYKSRTS